MSLMRKLIFAAVVVCCCSWSTSRAGVYVGVGFGGPGYYRPYGCCHRYGWGWGYGGYYRPYGFGVVVAPPPVVVGAPPVVVQQPAIVQQPVVVQPTYTLPNPAVQAPATLSMPTPTSTTSAAAPDLMPTSAVGGADLDTALQQLRNGDENTRAGAAVRLGRLGANQAVGPLVKALNSDSSAKVREAAARGLGLIGSPSALSALQYAAQADDDREVRHSAGFAYETIRSNPKRN
jgi:hypothetical protein